MYKIYVYFVFFLDGPDENQRRIVHLIHFNT